MSAEPKAAEPDPPRLPHLRVIDFGSALDPHAVQHLYGPDGPSAAQQTPEYAPPEAVFGNYWRGSRTVSTVSPLVTIPRCSTALGLVVHNRSLAEP